MTVADVFARVFEEVWPPENPYLRDPVGWIRDFLGEDMWSGQEWMANSVVDWDRIVVKAGHSVGKTRIISRLIAWFVCVHPIDQVYVVVTADNFDQITGGIWRELILLHQERKRLSVERDDPSLALPGRITLDAKWHAGADDRVLVAVGKKPGDKNPTGIQGRHARHMLCIIEEACHDDQTEVMTESGWRHFKELDGSERLLTMDPTTHEAYYVSPTKVIAKPYSGPMYEYEAKGGNFCVTPDHDLYWHGRSRGQKTPWRKAAAEVTAAGKGDRYMLKAVKWAVPDVREHVIPAYRSARKTFPELRLDMDAWMAFLGWYCSEGSLVHGKTGPSAVTITQKQPDNMDRIERLVRRLGFKARTYGGNLRIHHVQLARHLAELGANCLEKTVPDYARMASARQMNLLLDEYVLGDGYKHGNREIVYTSSPSMADALQEMILKTGLPSVVTKRSLLGRVTNFGTHTATSTADGYVVTRPRMSSEMKIRGGAIRTRHYEGMVYCASVPPDAMLFTRRNGYTLWSGNCGVPKEIWEAVDSLASNEGATVLAVGNPTDPAAYMAEVCKPGSGWTVKKIASVDTPEFTGERVSAELRGVLASKDWVERRKQMWGESSPTYISRILGEFPEISNDTLIQPKWIEAAQKRSLPRNWKPKLGVDVARYGEDETVIYRREGSWFRLQHAHHKTGTVETTGHIVKARKDINQETYVEQWVEIIVDEDGIGGGVVDQLQAQNVDVIGFRNGATAFDSERFVNRKAELYWMLRDMFEAGDADIDPADDVLAAQLGSIKWQLDSKGRIKVESKDDMRKRGLPSPDRADALMQTLADVASVEVETDDYELVPTLTGDLLDKKF